MNFLCPGDRALVVSKPEHSTPELRRYIGQTVTVVNAMSTFCGLFHTVRSEDGHLFAARPKALQKLPPQPPREEVTSWMRCVWRPTDMEILS